MPHEYEEVTLDEALQLMHRMARDLEEYADTGREAGSDMASTRQLLSEYEALYHRSGRYWVDQVSQGEQDAPGLLSL
ncbi:MAG: hypothetical protein AB1450_08145 [Pseudomonadota bacterium]